MQDILGAGGKFILAPCHNIQAVSPPENVVAMYETGYEYGWNNTQAKHARDLFNGCTG